MSHSFYLAVSQPLNAQAVLSATGLSGIITPPGFDQTEIWPEGIQHLYVDGQSVRPVEINLDQGEMEIRIFSCSCPLDYRLGVNLARAVAEQTGAPISPEGGASMGPAEFANEYGDAWITQNCLIMLSMMLRSLQGTADVAKLSGTRAGLEIGPRFLSSLLSQQERIPQTFFERFRRLNYVDREEQVYDAQLMTFQNNAGATIKISTYSEGLSTLLSAQADLICLNRDEDMVHLRLDDLATVLGEDAVWLSENLLLAPELHAEDWSALLAQVAEYEVSDIFALASVVDRAYAPATRASFGEEEWAVLRACPVWIFLLVAAADGKIDKKEIAGFQKKLAELGLKREGLIQEVILSLVAEIDEVLGQAVQQAGSAAEHLLSCAQVVQNTVAPEEAQAFKRELVELGKAIAESSGGFFGFGSRISKREKQALVAIAGLLGVESSV